MVIPLISNINPKNKMIMKRQIITWGMMLAAAFALTNCAKEFENPIQEPESVGYPFEIVASTVDTKTVNDGMSTKWAEGDQINLFHAEAGTIEYVNDTPYSNSEGHPFVVSDVVKGKFEGQLSESLDLQKQYDWYAFYPYSSYIKTPANISSGYVPVGSKSNEVQTQTGNSNMVHIAGANYPVAGYALAVPANDTPEIKMSHLSSLIEINVTNANDEDLTVTEIVFTAPVDVVGTYFINFAGAITPDSFKGSGADYVSNTASLNVMDGAAIANGESAKFYLAVRPFTAESGTELMVSVNGCSKTITLSSDVTFTAGKIKTLNFSYYKVAEPEQPEQPEQPEPDQPAGEKTVTISFANTTQRTSYSTSEQVWENAGVVFTNSKGSSTSNVGDYSNPARFYKSSDITVTAPGNIINIEFDCTNLDSKYKTPLDELAAPDGTSSTVTYETLSAQARANSVTVTYVIADPTAPSIIAGDVTGISARGVDAGELAYEVANLEYSDLTVEYDGTVVTTASKGEDGMIAYTVSANSTTSARDGFIKISNGDLTKEVKVSQLAPVFTVSRNAVELGATADSKTSVTVTSDFDWELSLEGSGYTVTPASYTWSEGGKSTVSIQASANRTEEGVADLGTITLTNSTTGQELTIEVTQATSYVNQEAVTVTMNIYANKGTVSGKSISWTQDGFTVTNNQASSSTAIRTSDSDHFRIYAKSELNFTSSDKTFDKVVVTCTSNSYATVLQTSANNAGLTATVSGAVVTISTSNPTNSMATITATAQTRINKVVVELK